MFTLVWDPLNLQYSIPILSFLANFHRLSSATMMIMTMMMKMVIMTMRMIMMTTMIQIQIISCFANFPRLSLCHFSSSLCHHQHYHHYQHHQQHHQHHHHHHHHHHHQYQHHQHHKHHSPHNFLYNICINIRMIAKMRKNRIHICNKQELSGWRGRGGVWNGCGPIHGYWRRRRQTTSVNKLMQMNINIETLISNLATSFSWKLHWMYLSIVHWMYLPGLAGDFGVFDIIRCICQVAASPPRAYLAAWTWSSGLDCTCNKKMAQTLER